MSNQNSFKQKQEPIERERVPVMFAGEKVGMATVDNSGSIAMIVHSPLLAKRFGLGITEHIAIVPKNKE